jgi:hypothetical protein
VIGQHAPEGHNDGHNQMRQRSHKAGLKKKIPVLSNLFKISPNLTHLFDPEVEHMLQIRTLVEHQQVKVPRPTEIGHNDGVDWH